jgi:hypothetical protein
VFFADVYREDREGVLDEEYRSAYAWPAVHRFPFIAALCSLKASVSRVFVIPNAPCEQETQESNFKFFVAATDIVVP